MTIIITQDFKKDSSFPIYYWLQRLPEGNGLNSCHYRQYE